MATSDAPSLDDARFTVEEGEHAQQTLERVLQAEQKRLLQERVRWQADFQQAKARLEGVNQRLQDLNVK